MPRPATFTAELQAFCDAEMVRFRAQQQRDPKSVPRRIADELFGTPQLRELWYCGTWLDRQLTAAGFLRSEVRAICRDNGQRAGRQPDPWPLTEWRLEHELKRRDAKPPAPPPAPPPGPSSAATKMPRGQFDRFVRIGEFREGPYPSAKALHAQWGILKDGTEVWADAF